MLILDVQYLEKREYFNLLHRRLINIFRILQYFPVNYPVNVGIGGRGKAAFFFPSTNSRRNGKRAKRD